MKYKHHEDFSICWEYFQFCECVINKRKGSSWLYAMLLIYSNNMDLQQMNIKTNKVSYAK
jgi:hypothetical protein